MSTYHFMDHPTSAQLREIIDLYRQAGWWTAETGNDLAAVAALIRGSHCFRVAMHNGRIIAMGRAISDGTSDAYIQDVTVQADFRGLGIATRIVNDLVARLGQAGIGWIGLIAEGESVAFYKRLGFAPMQCATPMLMLRK
jgi:ribosomal protein S18 acetylase RimI-like enzyme